MKRIFLFLYIIPVLFLAVSCQKENSGDMKPQTVTVKIVSPANDARVNSAEPFTIECEGGVDVGGIAEISLTVDGESVEIPEIKLPLKHEYTFPDKFVGRDVEIRLSVKGDGGKIRHDRVFINVYHLDKELGEITDKRDGKKYGTVKLGDQTWMSQNLAYVPDGHSFDSDISWNEPRYYVPFDYDANSQKELVEGVVKEYGVIYNWWGALDGKEPVAGKKSQGSCPDGWHLPAVSEWDKLIVFLSDCGMSFDSEHNDYVAKALAIDADNDYTWMDHYGEEAPTPAWPCVEPAKNNEAGFNARPTGFRACTEIDGYDGVLWWDSSYSAGWWSSEYYEAIPGGVEGFASATRMYSNAPYFVTSASMSPAVGLPVRCVKD